MEIEVEGSPREQLGLGGARLPGGKHCFRHGVLHPGGVLGEIALLGGDIESGEQRQSLVGDQRHDMALALDGPQLERQAGAQRVRRRNHLGARQPRGAGQRIEVKTSQQGQEQEQPAKARVEFAWRQRELPHVGHRLDGRTHA